MGGESPRSDVFTEPMKTTIKSISDRAREGSPAPPLAIAPRIASPGLGTPSSDLNDLLLSSRIAMILLDRSKCIQRFTPAACSLFSLLPTDIGRPIRDLSPKFVDPTFLSDVQLVLGGGEAPSLDVETRDGRWYVRQTLPYLLRDGAIEGALITFSDVAADALQEARLYAESIVNSVRDPLLVLDANLRVHSVNEPFSRLFQLSSQDASGRDLRDIGDGVCNVPRLREELMGVLATGNPMVDFELAYASPELGGRQLCLDARTLHRGGGRPDLILVSVHDVTDRRHIEALLQKNETLRREEEKIRERQLQLSHALRVSTVGELATGLAHELNQPLSAISNLVEACSRYVRADLIDPAQLLELLSGIAAESQRAAGIVAHLRSFIDKGEAHLEAVDLGDVVRHVPHLLSVELRRCGVELRIESSTTRLPVSADRIQIEQVIVNLLHNAIDSIGESSGKERRIEISARSAKGMAEIRVRDTGTGVSSEAAERMFQPFFTTKSQGLGMGLALSRSILEAHQGSIGMEAPTDGQPGVVVRFAIPLRRHKRQRQGRTAP